MRQNRKDVEMIMKIPLYYPEQDYFENKLVQNDNKKSRTARSLIRLGIKQYCEDSHDSFGEIAINVPAYAQTDLAYVIYVPMKKDSTEYRFCERMSQILKMPLGKVVRYFMIYDWRYHS